MNPYIKRLRLAFATPMAMLCVAPVAFAQDDESDDGEVFTLSPFTVNSTEDTGYRATSTLAGSRLKTNLGDVASSISVVTQEFLEDTGATDAEDLLVYTVGTEVVGAGGNFSGGIAANLRSVGTGNLDNALTQTRLRGLAAADRTRNYFGTVIEFDSYNTDRIAINRGANAALFGLGSPAGIINNSLKQAAFEDLNEVQLRIGSFDSYRASVDVNRAIIEDELAVRFSALHQDKGFDQEEAFKEESRIYGTVNYQKDFFPENDAWGRTILSANYEGGSVDENRPRIFPLNDGITMWFDPFDSSDFEGALFDPSASQGAINGVKPEWDGSTMGTGSNTSEFGGGRRSLLWVNNPIYRSPIVFYENEASATPSTPIDGVIGTQGIISGLPSAPGSGIFSAPQNLQNAMRFVGNPEWPFYANPVITDTSIFDYRNHLIDGPTKGEESSFDAYSASLEQLFYENKLGFKVEYDFQASDFHAQRRLDGGSESSELHIDTNRILMDGTPNDNFGRAFVADQGVVIQQERELESFRAQGFARVDFTDLASESWAKILGDHTFTGLFSTQKSYSFNRRDIPLSVDDPWAGIHGNTDSRIASNGRKVVTVHYLGDSLAGASSAAGANLPAIQANQTPTPATINDSLFRLNDFRDGTFSNVGLSADGQLSDETVIDTGTSITDIESKVLIWQSNLIGDTIAGTLSWREDEVDSFRSDNLEAAVFDGTVKDDSVSYGIVAKSPAWLTDKIPFLDRISLRYNTSENFQPTAPRRTIRGESIDNPKGETEDYGFSLDLFENKLSLVMTWFETSQNNNFSSAVDNGEIIVFEHGRVLNSTIAGANENLDADIFPEIDTDSDGTPDIEYVPPPQELLDLFGFSFDPTTGSRVDGNSSIANTTDSISEGVEVEILYNPTPNWTILMNVAKIEAVDDNTARSIIEYLQDDTIMTLADGTQTSILDAWSGPLSGFFNTASQSSNLAQIATEIQADINFTESQDGKLKQEIREWRFNLVTDYEFTDGRFKGFNVGGALRWQDKPAIGFELTTIDGDPASDVDKPIFGEEKSNLDAWIGYRTKIANDKVDWSIQLNIKNLLNDDDLVPVVAQPNGDFAVFAIPEGLTWELTSTFKF